MEIVVLVFFIAAAVVTSVIFLAYVFEDEIEEFVDFHFREETEYYKMTVYDGYCLRTIIMKAVNRNHLYHKMSKMEGKIALFEHKLSLQEPIKHITKEDLETELFTYKSRGGRIY